MTGPARLLLCWTRSTGWPRHRPRGSSRSSNMSEPRHSETLIWVFISILGMTVVSAQLVNAGREEPAEPRYRQRPAMAHAARVPVVSPAPGVEEDEFEESLTTVDLFVEAIVQVESAGQPRCVGKAGERGLMQIKSGTWRETTIRLFDAPVPFDDAFDPELNRVVGKAYLATLQDFLVEHRAEWQGDMRSLLAACYNAGPNRVLRAGFAVNRLPRSTRSYVERVSTLHDFYLASPASLPEPVYARNVDSNSGS